MAETKIKMYGAPWCGDCRRSKDFLDANKVPYDWFDVDQDPAAKAYVRKVNHNKVIIPTIVFPDGSVLVEPGNAELARKLKA